MNIELFLAYFVDILNLPVFNQLNMRLQGEASILTSHRDSKHAFMDKLDLYKKRASIGKFMTSQLEEKFCQYYTDLSPQHTGLLIKNTFLCQFDDVLEDTQKELIELIHESTAKNVFQSTSFWSSVMESYPKNE
ncbi:uncharacterized protein [Palaemon carinicauda]|uniref:uncharacterized protein n=1 Tax=Palaemon carinicauda TaxID=392227 RepID=UPI0035B64E14